MEKTLLLHIAAGGVALLAGYPALFARKGNALHRSSGTVFAWAMVVMGVSAVAVAVIRGLGTFGGLLPLYLAVTGVTAVRPFTVRVRGVTTVMMLLGFVISAGAVNNGLQAMRGVPAVGSEDVPIAMFFIMAAIVGSAAIGDAALLRFGPWTGRMRLARHLWRMCFALFAAAGSFFLGQAQAIPRPLRIMPLLIALSLLPLLAMLYWLWRVSRRHAYAQLSRSAAIVARERLRNSNQKRGSMKPARILFAAALLLLPTMGIAQSAGQKHGAETPGAAPTSAAQHWFEQLKTLAGTWQGDLTTEPAVPQMAGDVMNVTMTVTSMGNAFVHSTTSQRRPDNPITMIYLENDRLMLTHYCDSGNRPRMEARFSPDGKTVTFEFVDIVGPTKNGHMNRAVFTFVDADHHSEEWTYVMPNGAQIRARAELTRVQAAS